MRTIRSLRDLFRDNHSGIFENRWAGLAISVAGGLALTSIVVVGVETFSPERETVQSGHWTYNSTLGAAFHVNGGSKSIDAEIAVPGVEPGSRIVQSDESGYILGKGRVYEFGKSDLAVADPVEVRTNEWPLGLEAGSVAYAAHLRAGLVTRFGERRTTVEVGGQIGEPVVTAEGTLWLHRHGTGQLCNLPLHAERLSCPARVASGHQGALTMASGRPVFVDLTSATMSLVSAEGFGPRRPLGQVSVSETSILARAAVGERLAILETQRDELNLIDVAGLFGTRPPAPPITTQVRPGNYQRMESSGTVLALIDEATNTLVTLDREGRQVATAVIPVDPQASAEVRPPAVVVGEDSRLYVDSSTGDHVLVVDPEGRIIGVGVTRPPASTPRPTKSVAAVSDPAPPKEPVVEPTREPAPERSRRPRPRNPEPRSPEPEPQPTKAPQPPPSPSAPPPPAPKPTASKPGAPGNVAARASGSSATVTWRAAPAHGAPVTSYLVSWSGGSATLAGGARSTTVEGLASGREYVFSVRARNRVGIGPEARSGRVVTPDGVPGKPRNLVAVPGEKRVDLYWERPALNGGEFLRYEVAMVVEPWDVRLEDTTTERHKTWTGLGKSDDARFRFSVRAVTRAPDGHIRTGPPAEVYGQPSS